MKTVPPDVDRGLSLLPCPNPWCASSTLPLPVGLKRDGWRVLCGCGVGTYRCETRDEAITAWNTRPALEARPLPEGVGGVVERLTEDARIMADTGINANVFREHPPEHIRYLGDVARDLRTILAALEAPRPDDEGGEGLSSSRDHAPDISIALEALRKIAFLRPGGPTRNKMVEQMERIAIDALDELRLGRGQ